MGASIQSGAHSSSAYAGASMVSIPRVGPRDTMESWLVECALVLCLPFSDDLKINCK